MADAEDPKPKRSPGSPPGQPLPRLWKADPEDEETDDQPKRDRRSRRALEKEEAEAAKAGETAKPKAKPKVKAADKKSPKATDKPKKGVLLEETPELDTHQTRERIRMAIGGVLAVIVVGLIIYVMQGLKGPEFDEKGLIDEGAVGAASAGVAPVSGAAPANPNVQVEQEAANLLGTARQLAKNGKVKESTVVLERIAKSYPKTKTATLAKAALDRPKQNLPLFVEGGVVVASSPAPTATKAASVPVTAPAPAPMVVATDANATIITSNTPNAEATVRLPANSGERPLAPSEGSAASKGKVAARPLPAGFHIEAESGVHASGWPFQIVGDRDGAIMVLVPSGTFTIGRDDGTPDEGPSHKVKLTAFYMDQHEVTNRQYDLYLKESNRRRATKAATKELAKTRTEEDPVTHLTLMEAKAYCDWAGKVLPTEAQWEAAARSTDERLYPWGSADPVWSKPRVPRQIEPVGTYPLDQSPYGTIDMAGNAWEWTADWFDSKYYASIKGQVLINPSGPKSSRAVPAQVVVKGGSKKWVAAWREGLKPETKLPYVGFRGALVVETATEVAAPAVAAPAPVPANGPAAPPASKPGNVIPF